MANKNGYWVDKNNNKWSEKFYTEDEAQALSDTLINCKGCTNCISCGN